MKSIARNTFYFICFWFLATAFVDDPYSTDQSVAYWIVAAAFVLWAGAGIVKLFVDLFRNVNELFYLIECRLRGIPVPYDAGAKTPRRSQRDLQR